MNRYLNIAAKTIVTALCFAFVGAIWIGIEHFHTSETAIAQNTTNIDVLEYNVKTLEIKVDSTQPAEIAEEVEQLKKDVKDINEKIEQQEIQRQEDNTEMLKYIIEIYKNTPNTN